LLARHDVAQFPVARSSLAHSLAFLALIFWIIQIISGFLLLGVVSYVLEVQYLDLINVATHGNYLWLVRLAHMLGANFVVLFTLAHMGKAVTYSKVVTAQKLLIWLVGSALFLLSLAVAFTGYVVVAGNMSYWAALVILNLLSVVPFLGDEIVFWVLSSATVTSWSLRRFTVIHFLLAVIAIALIALHIVLLHRQSPSRNGTDIADNAGNLGLVLAKDLILTLSVTLLVLLDATKQLVHPDNWQSFSRLVTPVHIEPEVYFLWTFSAIKLHNGKLAGAGSCVYRSDLSLRIFICYRVRLTIARHIFCYIDASCCYNLKDRRILRLLPLLIKLRTVDTELLGPVTTVVPGLVECRTLIRLTSNIAAVSRLYRTSSASSSNSLGIAAKVVGKTSSASVIVFGMAVR
jgi:quinol-cytochrome oxidoreductase complex cytochrome b subunit